MSLIETLTSFQPSQKDIDNTPKSVQKYIQKLEYTIIQNIMKKQ